MTKDEMTSLLGSAGADPKTIDAMVQAYEMGFEHGAKVGDKLRGLVVEATAICHEIDNGDTADTAAFWALHNSLKDMQ
jgi:hypothetical protein